jgi:hypothetical protein
MLEKFTAVMTEDGASMNHTWHVLADRYRELYSDTQVKEVQQTLSAGSARNQAQDDGPARAPDHRTVPDNVTESAWRSLWQAQITIWSHASSNEHMETRARGLVGLNEL